MSKSVNSTDTETVKFLDDKLDELHAMRDEVDTKIAAIEKAREAITGTKPGKTARSEAPEEATDDKPAKTRRRKNKTAGKVRRIDKKANEKTIVFVKSRKRPTTPHAVATRFHITDAAAIQRLITLEKQGVFVRVGRGKYIDKDRAQTAPVNGSTEASFPS